MPTLASPELKEEDGLVAVGDVAREEAERPAGAAEGGVRAEEGRLEARLGGRAGAAKVADVPVGDVDGAVALLGDELPGACRDELVVVEREEEVEVERVGQITVDAHEDRGAAVRAEREGEPEGSFGLLVVAIRGVAEEDGGGAAGEGAGAVEQLGAGGRCGQAEGEQGGGGEAA
jgi:hypothetical protein